nr:LOB domain-containing protein 38-like [Ipomoea trifida]
MLRLLPEFTIPTPLQEFDGVAGELDLGLKTASRVSGGRRGNQRIEKRRADTPSETSTLESGFAYHTII